MVKRTVVFSGTICLKDTLSGREITQTPFRIFVEKPLQTTNGYTIENNQQGTIEEIFFNNETEEHYKTDQDGCVHISISLKNTVYNRQQYFKVTIHFLSEEFNLYSKVVAGLNPWQRAFQAHKDITKQT